MATTKKKRSKMPVSKATNAYELLGEIIEIILEEPKRYNQRYFTNRPDDMPSCGTVGCVFGWVAALKGGSPIDADEVLGLNGEQAEKLFRASAAGNTAPQTEAHAKRGAAHIRRFMKAHEAQLKAKKV